MVSKVTVKAPSSTANLGPGFDVFGLAVNAFYDTVILTKTKNEMLLKFIRLFCYRLWETILHEYETVF